MKKYLSVILALALIFTIIASCTLIFIMKSRIDDLNSKVELYKPSYIATLAATYGKDGVILASDVLDDYEESVNVYAQYGVSIDSYGWSDDLKIQILDNKVQRAILLSKAKEMELDTLSNEELNQINETVNTVIDGYVSDYIDYYYPDTEATQDTTAEAESYWAEHGLDRASYRQTLIGDKVLEKLEAYITKDIAISDSDLHASYDDLLKEQEESFDADPDAFITAVNDGETIIYTPSGYRMVNYILIPFDDDSVNKCAELNETLSDLQSERNAAGTADATRTLEEIDADIKDCTAELEALYTDLDTDADTIISEFNDGTAFNDLVVAHCQELPQTTENQDGSTVYPVCTGNTYWDSAFTEAAMSLEKINTISKPVHCANGTYVIYYDSDIVPGVTDFDTIAATLREKAIQEAKENCYEAQVQAWIKDANPVYYYENIGITSDVTASTETVDADQ